eukprot:19052-Heterococcus_DN1.PRE.1
MGSTTVVAAAEKANEVHGYGDLRSAVRAVSLKSQHAKSTHQSVEFGYRRAHTLYHAAWNTTGYGS